MLTGPMAVEARAHLAVESGLRRPAARRATIGMVVSAISSCALHAQFVQAGLRHVLRVGLQLGRGRRQFAAAVARLVEQLAGLLQ